LIQDVLARVVELAMVTEAMVTEAMVTEAEMARKPLASFNGVLSFRKYTRPNVSISLSRSLFRQPHFLSFRRPFS